MAHKLIFLLGGARSGKSAYAEHWGRSYGKNVLFVATAEPFDDEMRERIARHRAERPSGWHTLEAPTDVGRQIAETLKTGQYDTLLFDCVTLLASNILLKLPDDCSPADADDAILREVNKLIQVYRQSNATWLIVSNEVGMGVVPPSRLGRVYRDGLGRANQQIAMAADEVILLVAGLPWVLKKPI